MKILREFYKDYEAFVVYKDEAWFEIHDLHPCNTFKEKRRAHNAYTEMINDLKKEKLEGWLTWVEPTNRSALRLMLHLGAIPYHVLPNNRICFVKEVL